MSDETRKPVELEEDEYIQAISEIVERDFFPNLKKMRIQNDLLGAVQNEEFQKAHNLSLELDKMSSMTPLVKKKGMKV